MRQPVYLVRHGQSEWNSLRLTQGQVSHPQLTELGRRQAESAAQAIAADLAATGLAVSRIVSSDLARAVATAEVIASRLGTPVTCDERLREQHLGSLEGRGYEETWAAAEAHDWSDPTLPVAGGESVLEVYRRMGDVLEALEPDRVTVLVSHGDAIRAALAHLEGVAPHRAAWVEVPNGAVARVDGAAVVWLPQHCWEDDRMQEGAGIPGVTLVGGGPGHPDLITVAGMKALLEADVVVADHLAPRALLTLLPPETEVIDVAKLPRGKSVAQERINRILVEKAKAGNKVVRLKGGDNFVFGRGHEEVIACQEEGVPVQVVPGLSSAIAVPGLAGVPVTHRGTTHDFTVVSGHLPPSHPDSLTNWSAVAAMTGTIVLMMAVQNAGSIADALVAGGRSPSTPTAVVSEGSTSAQRTFVTTLGQLGSSIAAHEVRPPAIIVIGEVVALGAGSGPVWSP